MSHTIKTSALLRRLARMITSADTPKSVYQSELKKIVEKLTDLLQSLLNDVNELPEEFGKARKVFKKIVDEILFTTSEVDDFFSKSAASDPAKLMSQLPEIKGGLQTLIKAIEKYIVHDKEVWAQVPERQHKKFDNMYEKLNSLALSVDRLSNEMKRDFEKSKLLQKQKGPDIGEDEDIERSLSEGIEKIQK